MQKNIRNDGCSQRDSAEHKGYVRAHCSFNRIWKERNCEQPDLLVKILERDNLNKAFKRVKANKGAPGVDGMTIDEMLQWLKEHNRELTYRIRRGKYTPKPVRRVESPKTDGGVHKLGVPAVIDCTIQQTMLQQMIPIFELLFWDGSYGYLPGRSVKDSILKMLKQYLRSGVMENGVVIDTEEGTPQGGNLSQRTYCRRISASMSSIRSINGEFSAFATQTTSPC